MDGIDLECNDNCYLNDFEVINRDKCVSVKTPSKNVLIEDTYCNHSHGMSIGLLSADAVTSITAAIVESLIRNSVYSYQSTQMLMIRTFPSGSSTTWQVKDSTVHSPTSSPKTVCMDWTLTSIRNHMTHPTLRLLHYPACSPATGLGTSTMALAVVLLSFEAPALFP